MIKQVVAVLLSFTAFSAAAHDFTVGALNVDHPWARPSVTANGAVFFLVQNKGEAADRLIAATTPMAERVEIHTIERDGNFTSMRQVEGGLVIPPGGEALLSPDGYHVMLLGLEGRLEVGSSFPITLTFEKAGTLTVDVKVEPLGYDSDDAHAGHH